MHMVLTLLLLFLLLRMNISGFPFLRRLLGGGAAFDCGGFGGNPGGIEGPARGGGCACRLGAFSTSSMFRFSWFCTGVSAVIL